jgi:glycerophosphoryl diester phosphodiesterase
MGADVIEPDVVLTKDGVPICSHDVTLDETTDVADKFPGRARD